MDTIVLSLSILSEAAQTLSLARYILHTFADSLMEELVAVGGLLVHTLFCKLPYILFMPSLTRPFTYPLVQ